MHLNNPHKNAPARRLQRLTGANHHEKETLDGS